MKVLIAPDKFKHALSAAEAADALAAGVRDAAPDAGIELCPLADGGEGTGPLLACALGAAPRAARCRDALGRPIEATWWLHAPSRRAIVELATVAGLQGLPREQRDPEKTTTFGVGEALRAAIDAGAQTVDLAVGGSATVDGGAGCLQALGVALLDASGAAISTPLTGGALTSIARIGAIPRLPARIRVLCDVRNPLLGPRGAAPSFAPQKGASPDAVRRLEQGLRHWRDVLHAATGVDVADLPHAGAAGGIGAGLHAALGAALTEGFAAVAESVNLSDRIAAADLVITGEGRLDAQTVEGKVVAGVARLAAEAGTPAVALVGAADPAPDGSLTSVAQQFGLAQIGVITPAGATLDAALRATRENLRAAARELIATRGCS